MFLGWKCLGETSKGPPYGFLRRTQTFGQQAAEAACLYHGRSMSSSRTVLSNEKILVRVADVVVESSFPKFISRNFREHLRDADLFHGKNSENKSQVLLNWKSQQGEGCFGYFRGLVYVEYKQFYTNSHPKNPYIENSIALTSLKNSISTQNLYWRRRSKLQVGFKNKMFLHKSLSIDKVWELFILGTPFLKRFLKIKNFNALPNF